MRIMINSQIVAQNNVMRRLSDVALSPTVERPVRIPASTETEPIAAYHRNAMKPQVSAHIEKATDDSALQFWGIGSRDLGNVPNPALEHPR